MFILLFLFKKISIIDSYQGFVFVYKQNQRNKK